MYSARHVQALLFLVASLLVRLPFGLGGGSPVNVSTACEKLMLSRASTRAITLPLIPQPRQLNTCLVVLMENRSSPPHLGHGPSRSTVSPLSMMLRRAITSSMRTARAFATQGYTAEDIYRLLA